LNIWLFYKNIKKFDSKVSKKKQAENLIQKNKSLNAVPLLINS